MAHRLTLNFVGYQGRVLDYDNDAGFRLEEFRWKPIEENEKQNNDGKGRKTENIDWR